MPKGLRRVAWEARAKPLDQVVSDESPAPLDSEAETDLMTTIRREVIPHLIATHRGEEEACTDARPPPTEAEVRALADIAVSSDLSGALGFVETLGKQGLSIEVVLLQLLTPAAQLLGDQWLADDRSFSEVTAGLSTLQQLVHILGPSFAPGVADRGHVILASPFSEQHTLGVYVVGEFLRRAGWSVRVAPSLSEVELVDLVRSEHIEMAGVSVSCNDSVATLKGLVAKVRAASKNPHLIVMIGGTHPELAARAEQLGVEHAADAQAAVRRLDELSVRAKASRDER